MRSATARPLADRVELATASATDLPSLAQAVLAVVAQEVPSVFACLATLDPANGLITGAWKSSAIAAGDEEFSAAEYGGPDVNRFEDLARRPVPVGVLSVDTDGQPGRSRRFREFMAPRFGFTDELRLACRARGTAWAALALYRDASGPASFTAEEGRRLAPAHEAVADAVRRVLLATPPHGVPPAPVPAVLVVDGRDRVTDAGPAAEALIDDLGGRDHGSLPANVLAVAAATRTAGAPTSSRVRTRSGTWLAVRALPLTANGDGVPLVLTIEPAAQAAVGQVLLAAQGLTVRETEVVQQVLQGRSTKSIAAALHLSLWTVQDHLKSVFEKVGVGSRGELIARFVE